MSNIIEKITIEFLICTLLLSLFSLLSFVSCSRSDDPESVLREYIDYRLSKNQKKDVLLSYTTDEMYEQTNAYTDEDFKEFEKQISNYHKKYVDVKHASCDELSCNLTYVIVYEIFDTTKAKKFDVEVKKIAEMINTDKGWKVANINNVKTFIDSVIPINVVVP